MTEWKVRAVKSARSDLKKAQNSYLRDSLRDIIETLKQNPYDPVQYFEKLTPPGQGKYSRRLNGQHRVVYSIDKNNHIVTILSAWSHYE
ncbi:Txe/YoeB family addiction module toxin [Pediococcus inopinatus]|uniref:Txe/YoeB family addiction module toxin n=1 Tax=Pediococcus inopinatus TaxID=114090 RepID=UPI00070D29EF|nr:Txe/YoeB family addiction module toxin [Pediococcus inopinatus]AVK99298.1 addiction module protein [Pediococcus inopinatus]